MGNSNVGKSSLTRLLLTHPDLYKGKIGKTAGSTVRLTIINDTNLPYHVIDLPGFGKMTRLDRDMEAEVQDQILNYIEKDQKNIFLMIIVVSAERVEDELEKWFYQNQNTVPLTIEMIQMAIEYDIPCVVALNKIYKVVKVKRPIIREKLLEACHAFEIHISTPENPSKFLDLIETSVVKGEGIRSIKNHIHTLAKKINLKNYDDRNQYRQLPVIGSKEKEDKSTDSIHKDQKSNHNTKFNKKSMRK